MTHLKKLLFHLLVLTSPSLRRGGNGFMFELSAGGLASDVMISGSLMRKKLEWVSIFCNFVRYEQFVDCFGRMVGSKLPNVYENKSWPTY